MNQVTIALNGQAVLANVFAKHGDTLHVIAKTDVNSIHIGRARFHADETFKGTKGVYLPTVGECIIIRKGKAKEAIDQIVDYCLAAGMTEKQGQTLAKMYKKQIDASAKEAKTKKAVLEVFV
jgi:hypothetical protein